MPEEAAPGLAGESDNEPDSGVPAGLDPEDGAGNADEAGVPRSGAGDEEGEEAHVTATARITETSRHVELAETITQSLLPDGSEETVRSTRTDETIRRTAVPHQAPGSAYPAPVG